MGTHNSLICRSLLFRIQHHASNSPPLWIHYFIGLRRIQCLCKVTKSTICFVHNDVRIILGVKVEAQTQFGEQFRKRWISETNRKETWEKSDFIREHLKQPEDSRSNKKPAQPLQKTNRFNHCWYPAAARLNRWRCAAWAWLALSLRSRRSAGRIKRAIARRGKAAVCIKIEIEADAVEELVVLSWNWAVDVECGIGVDEDLEWCDFWADSSVEAAHHGFTWIDQKGRGGSTNGWE